MVATACRDAYDYTRYDFAAAQLNHAVRNLPETHFFNVIVFDQNPTAFMDTTVPANKENQARLVDFLGLHDPRSGSGNTNWETALKLAYGMPNVDAIHFMTDGTPNKGCDFVESKLPCRRSGIPVQGGPPIHAVTFMPQESNYTRRKVTVTTIMDGLARFTGGSAREPFPKFPAKCPPRVGVHLRLSGCGVNEVNGVWWQSGQKDGRPRYERKMDNNQYFIEWVPEGIGLNLRVWRQGGHWRMWTWFGWPIPIQQEMFFSFDDRQKIATKDWSSNVGTGFLLNKAAPQKVEVLYDLDDDGHWDIDPPPRAAELFVV